MQEWWESLSTLLRVLYCIAIPSTLILVLQLVLTMAGGHGDAGIEVSDTSGLDMDVGSEVDLDLNGNGIPDYLETPDGAALSDGGNPADFGNLRFLTMQTIVTFLASFSWVAIICVSSGLLPLLSVAIGIGCGVLMMFLVARMVQASRKLAENGAINLRNAIGENATVYVGIPPKNQGTGKITMQLSGRFGEFDAVSADDTAFSTGAQVLVTDVVGDTLVVESAE